MTFTFGSLFAGIGGLDLGLERAGMVCEWQVEIDGYCSKVLEKHWPDVRRYGDVRDCGRHNLEPVDLICGGFPCQDVSYAGKRKGLREGTRTGLWYEFARIIRELGPRWALAENVPGLLSVDSGRGMGTVLRDLAESGYDAEWDCIPAAAFGAPHLRYRVFIVAYAIGTSGAKQKSEYQEVGASQEPARDGQDGVVANADRVRCRDERLFSRKDTRIGEGTPRQFNEGSGVMANAQSREPWQQDRQSGGQGAGPRGRDSRGHQSGGWEALADATGKRLEKQRLFQGLYTGQDDSRHRQNGQTRNCWQVEPDVGRVADGIPSRVDRLRCLGNAVVPQVAEWLGRRILEADARWR